MRLIVARMLICFALMAAAWEAEAAPRPFRLIDGQVVISVTLNGREMPALLDTGATHSLMSAELAAELGVPSKRQSGGATTGASGKRVARSVTRTVSLDIGAGLRRPRFHTYENGDHAFAPEGVEVLVGMDVLNRMAVAIDFSAMTIDIQPASKMALPADGALAMKRNNYMRPKLTVEVGGVDVEMLLDTAASGALHLQRAVVDRSPALRALPATRRQVVGIDGASEFDAIVVPRLALGGRVFADVRATIAPRAIERAISADGVIGVELLRRFRVVFDFDRDRVWLTPLA